MKLIIEYEGTQYAGWQIQPNAVGIQQVLQNAIAEITGEQGLNLIGSGRTDAGVHALGQTANFTTNTSIPAADLVHAVNTNLPDDVAVVHAEDVAGDFHARYSAKSKTYRYSILNQRVPSPIHRRWWHLVRKPLDLEAVRTAAPHFIGWHDFAAFQSKPIGARSAREISMLVIESAAPEIAIYVAANGFLYNMVRAIAGTLIEVGLGKRTPESILELIASGDRSAAGPTAPAQGLCLMEVEY